jgi:hypothetical protein
MAGACVTPGRNGRCNNGFGGKPVGRDHFGTKKGVDGRLMLEFISSRQDRRVWTKCIWLWLGTSIGLPLTSDSIKCVIFLG